MYFQYKGFRFHLTQRSNAKRISMTARKNAEAVSLTAPPWAGTQEIRRFLDANMPWLQKYAPKVTDFLPHYEKGEDHAFAGYRVTLGEHGIPTGKAFLTMRQHHLERLIEKLLPEWEARMHVKINEVRYRNTVSQWGSCQPQKGIICLATNLALVPKECVEYILVHELCHMHYANHSPLFYADMDRYLPGWRELKEKLSAFDLKPRPPKI